jgi:hypothetical protein
MRALAFHQRRPERISKQRRWVLAGIEESRQPVAFIAAFRVALLTITPNPTHF